jgi:hypothetical protein
MAVVYAASARSAYGRLRHPRARRAAALLTKGCGAAPQARAPRRGTSCGSRAGKGHACHFAPAHPPPSVVLVEQSWKAEHATGRFFLRATAMRGVSGPVSTQWVSACSATCRQHTTAHAAQPAQPAQPRPQPTRCVAAVPHGQCMLAAVPAAPSAPEHNTCARRCAPALDVELQGCEGADACAHCCCAEARSLSAAGMTTSA